MVNALQDHICNLRNKGHLGKESNFMVDIKPKMTKQYIQGVLWEKLFLPHKDIQLFKAIINLRSLGLSKVFIFVRGNTLHIQISGL